MLRVCVFSALVPALCAAAPPRDEYLYLNSFFDVDGFAPGGRGPEGNLGGTGTSFPASGLPEGRTVQVHSTRFGKVTFLRPQTDGHKKNMIAADGQKIRVRTSKVFNTLFVLGTAHHGGHAGWVEFEFEGGEKGRGPLAFSDWYAVADFGEEEAFTARSPTGNAFGNKVRLFLQYTPIPRARKLRFITLPELPRVKITALTLGWRDGVEPIEPRRPDPVEPAPVAIFSEPAFPYSHAVRRIAPEALAEGFRRVGIPTALLNVEQLAEPRIFNSKSFPVLVHPYGRVFPHAAADALRRFRSEGGISVHTGPPFVVAAVKSPYGGWTYLRKSSRDTGKVTDFIDPGKPGYLGSGQAREGGGAPLEATDLLRSWGLGGIDWKDFRAHHGWTRAPFPFAIDRASVPTGAAWSSTCPSGSDPSISTILPFKVGWQQVEP